MVIRTAKKPDNQYAISNRQPIIRLRAGPISNQFVFMFWLFIYAIVFVATFGGMVFTLASLVTGIVNKDRRVIDFGLRILLFTAISGLVLLLLVKRLGYIYTEELKNILDSF